MTAEDLKEHEGEGYTAGSVIGRSGVEGLFEKELKGQNVRLTIDADLQAHIYEQFQSDKSCSAAVNPDTGEVLALVSTPSYFCNEGNIKKPYLLFTQENASEDWISGAFSRETADIVLEGMKKVVNDANGTGYGAHREDVLLAGKTGTAEIKTSKEDTSGTELGWFAIFTAEKTAERPILLVSMTEDVKERGGSGYAVEKASLILEQWLAGN